MRELTDDEFAALRDKSAFEIVKFLKIPVWQIPFMIHRGRVLFKQYTDNIRLVVGMKPVLAELKKRGYHLAILTSNTKATVDTFLQKYELDFFDYVKSEKNLFGKHHSLKKILAEKKLKKDEVVYVGDEVRDIEACHKIKMDIISVTWGFNSKKILEKYKPTYIADTPEEILQYLTSEI